MCVSGELTREPGYILIHFHLYGLGPENCLIFLPRTREKS